MTDLDIIGKGVADSFNKTVWDKATESSIDLICWQGGFYIDKIKNMINMKPKQNTKANLFTLLDANEDGEVTKSEMNLFYSKLDAEGTGTIKPEKLTQWMDNNLDSICAEKRPEIMKELLSFQMRME